MHFSHIALILCTIPAITHAADLVTWPQEPYDPFPSLKETSTTEAESSLKEHIERFYTNFRDRKWAELYDMMYSNFKEKVSKEQFLSLAPAKNSKPFEFRKVDVLSTQLYGRPIKDAKIVDGRIVYPSESPLEIAETIIYFDTQLSSPPRAVKVWWVVENGSWKNTNPGIPFAFNADVFIKWRNLYYRDPTPFHL